MCEVLIHSSGTATPILTCLQALFNIAIQLSPEWLLADPLLSSGDLLELAIGGLGFL